MNISLALGGGGSKGNAHIGVLRVLEREGFHVRAIAGTSAGGVVAAAYAAGYSPDEIENHISRISQGKLYGRQPGDGPALLGVAGVARSLTELLGERTFSDLRIPCAVTAVDIESSQEVILRQGRVVDALLASIAIPGIFPPKQWEDHLLADGGVLDPVPVSVARSLAPDLPVVAVVLSPPQQQWADFPTPDIFSSSPVLGRLTRLRVAQAFEIFIRSVDIGTRMLTELRLQVDKPEIIIRPEVGHIGLLEKADVTVIVKLGEQAAEAALPELHRAVSWRGKLARRLSKLI